VRTAASLMGSAIRSGDTVQVFAEGRRPLFVPPGAGEQHLAHCLYELLRARADGTTPFLDLLERESPRLPAGSSAAILFGTISVADARLEELLEGLRSGGVRPLLVFVDNHSFIPIDRLAMPREQAQERARDLRGLMSAHGAQGAVLGAEQELEDELRQAGLFGEPA
jgi:uncharacterized protein (DUF58 family)